MKKYFELGKEEEQRVLEIQRKAIIVNAMESTYSVHPQIMFSNEYFQKLKSVGITCGIVTDAHAPTHNFIETIKRMCVSYGYIDQNKISMATTVEDIKRAKEEGKVALVRGFQNATPIEYDLDLLTVFHRLGVRVIGLMYNERNLLGDGCEEKTDCGLSKFGTQAVEEMNKLGILIDLSHVGYRSSMDAMETSKDPVIFSHSNARALSDHYRNITDEQIKALAEKDGVMGIAVFTPLVGKINSNIENYLDHIDYVVKLVGVDHVGIGLDFIEGLTREEFEALKSRPELALLLRGLELETVSIIRSITEFTNITRGLVARGYSDEEIQKILGGNFLRVFEKVWRQ